MIENIAGLVWRVAAETSTEGPGVDKDDMIQISVDDHIFEPPDMFKNHLQKK